MKPLENVRPESVALLDIVTPGAVVPGAVAHHDVMEGGLGSGQVAGSGNVRADGLDADAVEGLARRHEEPITSQTAEADIRAGFGKANHADAFAVRRKDLHARAGARPDVAVRVAANTVRR